MKGKYLLAMPVLLLMLGLMSIAASETARNAQILILHATDSPIEIRCDQCNSITSDNSFTVINKTERGIENIFLSGLLFSKNEKFDKVFLQGIELKLQAHSTIQIKINLQNLINPDTTSLILIPSRVHFETLASGRISGERKKTEYGYWILYVTSLKTLNPSNIYSFHKVEGKMANYNFDPQAPCYFCQWCEEDAWGMCGQNFIGGNCRSTACVQSFYCSCLSQVCQFSCKSPEYCC